MNKNSYIITPILDEEDGTPVFEVKTNNGEWATNCIRLDDALDIIRERIRPAQTLEDIARDWVESHGTVWYDNNGAELCEDMEIDLTEDQLDIVARLVQSATVTVTFE